MEQLSLFDLPIPAPPPAPRVIAATPAPDDPAPLVRAGWRHLRDLVWLAADEAGRYEIEFADESEVAAACALLSHDPAIRLRDLLEALGAEEESP